MNAAQRVREAWGQTAPEWVQALARACDAHTLRKVAAMLKVSPALVSLNLRRKTDASELLEKRVKSRIMVNINPQPLQQADVYTAVYNFVQAFALPALEPANIFRAWQNRSALPPTGNEYAVITLLYANRRGTNAQNFDFDPNTEDDGILTLLELKEAAVQIDFYTDDDSAEQRASALELVMRSELASLFFAPYGISPLYAEDPKELTGVDGSRQYVKRYMITLHLSFYASVAATVGWFDHVNLVTYNPDTYEVI